MRAELFRSLLLQKIEFFDVHTASKLTNLISTELDSVRSFVFRNVSRDRGPRAVLEVTSTPPPPPHKYQTRCSLGSTVEELDLWTDPIL